MFVRALLLLLIPLPHIVSQVEYQRIPLRFDLVINHLLQFQRFIPPDVDYKSYSITPEKIFALLQPYANNDTTTECEKDSALLIEAAMRLEKWALKVFDSWGKPIPSGVLKGHVLWLGNYDECVDPLYEPINKTFFPQPFKNQYCAVFPSGKNLQEAMLSGITIGICVPASCNRQTIAATIRTLFENGSTTENDLLCSNDAARNQKSLTGGAIATCVVLSLLGFLVLMGTITDYVLTYRRQSVVNASNHKSSSDIELSERKLFTPPQSSRFSMGTMFGPTPRNEFIAQLSAIRTLRRIFTMEKKTNDKTFAFIDGLRVLSLFWVILGHTLIFCMYYTNNLLDVLVWSRNIGFQLITSGVLGVDTFFVLSGFLTSILFAREMTKEKLSFRLLLLYYVHRYIRLTPAFLLVTLVSVHLTPYFGRGPVYPSVQGFETEGCRHQGWWTGILYIGNLFKGNDMCLPVSWYLYNDMQFHWIAPLALIPFVLGRKFIGFIVAILFVLVSIGSILGIALYYPDMGLAGVTSVVTTGPNYFEYIYIKPWCRIAPYAIGLLSGFIVINKYRLNTYTKIVGSLLATVFCLACILALYPDNILVPGLNRSSLVAYQVLSRPCWALFIAWLLFLCSTNQGGFVNTFLSWPVWLPLARLNYSAFLIHSVVLYTTIYNQKEPTYCDVLVVMNKFISNLFYSYVAAIVVVIFIENPFFVLEKKIFRR